MLPADFILPYDATPDSPMPEYVPAPGPTGIAVEAAYFTWMLPPHCYRWLAKPRIVVNGREIADAAWGTTHVPVPPGVHHVRVGTDPHWIVALRIIPATVPANKFGFADAMIPVVPGHSTTVHYQSPLNNVPAGALGPEPRQRFPGWRYYRVMMPVLVAVTLVCAVMFVLCVVKLVFG